MFPLIKSEKNQTHFKFQYSQKSTNPTMYEPQQLLDLQDNNGGFGAGADSRSWLSGDDRSPTIRRTDSSLSNSAAGTVDRTLFNDLVQIVPLVQSLIVILFSFLGLLFQFGYLMYYVEFFFFLK